MAYAYFVTDLLPGIAAAKGWTIAGAYDHRNEFWRAIVAAGLEKTALKNIGPR